MNKNKIIKILIAIFFMLLPFLDILRTTHFKDIEVLNIAVIELINIVLIGTALLLTVTKTSKKRILLLLLYLGIVGVYIGFHNANMLEFDTSLFARANLNIISETFYILRVFVLPIILLFVLLNNKDIFNKEYYFKIAKWLICVISFSIIILNILKLSYSSYGPNGVPILHNMFDYFLYGDDFKLLASRGFFDSANELSAILFMLLPLNIYMLYKEKTKFNVVLYASQFLAMILLGTRTAAYGSMLISVVASICYIGLLILKKEKTNEFFNNTFFITVLICTAFLTISPFMLGRINEGTPDFSIKNIAAYDEIKITDVKNLDKLILKYQSEYLINGVFLKMYPVNKDPEFWFKIIKRDKALNNNNRIMKTDILNRIYERNDNKNDKWFGMGYTINFMDLERDYYYQFYLFGIFGLIILVGPYFVMLGYFAVICIRHFKESLRLKTILGFMSVILGLIIAYFSGHVFGWVSPMMVLVFSLGILSIIVYEITQEKAKKKISKSKNKKVGI